LAENFSKDFARRRQLPRLVERALRDAEVADVFPTPLGELQRVLGIEQVVSIDELPDPPDARVPPRWKKILGALLYREKTIFVDFSQGEERSNFTEAHETAHQMIPWHEDAFILDHEATLFREVKEGLEEEANYGATALIFQNGRFHRRALEYERSISTPILLAPEYRASRHATIRHYVEMHPEQLALLITGRFTNNGCLPIWKAVESNSFRERFGPLGRLFPAQRLDHPPSLHEIAEESMAVTAKPQSCTVRITDRGGNQRQFKAEAFFNQYCVFLMFSPKARVRTGRRVVVATQQPSA
jgi:IrrE N-terminal-like domain